MSPPSGLDALAALFPYRSPVSGLVLAGKNRGRRELLSELGRELGGSLASDAWRHRAGSPNSWVITWVPSERSARRRRGFDQGRILAEGVAQSTGLSVRRLILRPRGTSRVGADRQSRLVGLDLRVPVPAPPSVVLVDDVVTTGASMTSAAVALRAAGAKRIVGLAVARAERS